MITQSLDCALEAHSHKCSSVFLDSNLLTHRESQLFKLPLVCGPRTLLLVS